MGVILTCVGLCEGRPYTASEPRRRVLPNDLAPQLDAPPQHSAPEVLLAGDHAVQQQS